jgi:glutaconyl-CoA/methylmalonyl-CoA decarboxylase subunit gamma
MKKFKFTINGNVYEVDIKNVDENIAELEVNGTPYTVEVDKVMQTTKTPKLIRTTSIPSTDSHPSVAKTSNPVGPKGSGHVRSPLPGIILEMHVKVGDMVKTGQKLLTLEAMKMENSIDSDKDGKVLSINVSKGDAVMEGDVLITIGE